MGDVLAGLKRYFGFDSFLDSQESVVRQILEGRDLCVIMPTGAGKSLCYQLPILMKPGYGVVVSPLISLMKDQVDSLRRKGIAAEFINSSVPASEQYRILRAAADGMVKMLYVAPERFAMSGFQSLLTNQPPSLVVVDEAHCISQWGHDFRPSYLQLGQALEVYRVAQICAFTATATPLVRDDIRKNLHRPEMELCVAGFKRPNLAFSVVEAGRNEDKLRVIGQLLKDPKPTIIYTSTRKAVEQLAAELDCIAYHAGMSDEERSIAQDRFMHDPAPVLAATNAFGMGIDRPDVRRVIHYNMTGSLEAYYQEAGRAGRDGEPADCILLFSYSDRFIQEFLIDMNNPEDSLIRNLYMALLNRSARQHGDPILEVTLAELVPETDGAKNETQIGSAMAILEKTGYCLRGFRAGNQGKIRFLGNLRELKLLHQVESTQRSRFINRMLDRFGGLLIDDLPISYDDLAQVAGLQVEQIKRVVRALDGECIAWSAPFSGRTTELLRPDDIELNIDFEEIRRKRDFEMARLDVVMGYTRTGVCRQRYLIEYFGENTGDWRCESCDLCGNQATSAHLREASESEMETIRLILSGVAAFEKRIGAGKLSLVLAGSNRSEIAETGLVRHPLFGLLKELKQNRILSVLKNLESQECVGRSGGEYPTLLLLPRGREILAGHGGKLMLDCPDLTNGRASSRPDRTERAAARAERRRTSAIAAADDPEAEALFQHLRKLRHEIAQRRNLIAFQVFSDATLHEIAARRPATLEDAAEIKGVGPAKLQTVVPLFLKAIEEFDSQE